MAFSVNGLKRITPAAEGASLWHYATNDAAAVMDTYFDDAAFSALVKAGDIVICSFDVDGATPVGEMFIVTASSGATVTAGAIDTLGT